MPVHNVCFRPVCGVFVNTFCCFMARRAKLAKQMRCQVITVRNKPELVLFLFAAYYLISLGRRELCSKSDSVSRVGNVSESPLLGNCHVLDFRFIVTMAVHQGGTMISSGSYINPSTSDFLMLCGDIETNPGPDPNDSSDKQNTNDLIIQLGDTLGSGLDDVSREVKVMSGSMKTMSSQLEELKSDLHKKQVEINEVKTRTNSLEQKVATLTDQLEMQDIMSRKDNIIMYGVTEKDDKETEDDTLRTVVALLNTHDSSKTWVRDDFSCVFRLGKRDEGQSRPRPVVAKLLRNRDKRNLISSKTMRRWLKGDGVRLNDDLTVKQRAQLSALRDKGYAAYYRGTRLVHWVREQTDNAGGGGGNKRPDLQGRFGGGDLRSSFTKRHDNDDWHDNASQDWAPPLRRSSWDPSDNERDDVNAAVGANSSNNYNHNDTSERRTPPQSTGRGWRGRRTPSNGRGVCVSGDGSSDDVLRGFGRGSPRGGRSGVGSQSSPTPDNVEQGSASSRPCTRLQMRSINSYFGSGAGGRRLSQRHSGDASTGDR